MNIEYTLTAEEFADAMDGQSWTRVYPQPEPTRSKAVAIAATTGAIGGLVVAELSLCYLAVAVDWLWGVGALVVMLLLFHACRVLFFGRTSAFRREWEKSDWCRPVHFVAGPEGVTFDLARVRYTAGWQVVALWEGRNMLVVAVGRHAFSLPYRVLSQEQRQQILQWALVALRVPEQ